MENNALILFPLDTGCGKTTVVQFLSVVFGQELYTVNCHATTETSDLIGGLRPVRGRDTIQRQILNKLEHLIQSWPHKDLIANMKMPKYISDMKDINDPPTLDMDEQMILSGKEPLDVDEMLSLARLVFNARPEAQHASSDEPEQRKNKRRKLLESSSPSGSDASSEALTAYDELKLIFDQIEDLGRRYAALFEWSDGPLVNAMKNGQMLLLDEMSLAEDAVLERLNSVLEPSRTLVLAEKGDDGTEVENQVIIANDGFRIFATMNPGGDFGKRELSPALRSRFTEIWVPAVTDECDFELVLGRTLLPLSSPANSDDISPILRCILTYVDWFNNSVCGEPDSPYSGYALTLRDVLSWARFIVESRGENENLGIWEAYCHGACLMHLDGLGLGAGLAIEDASNVKAEAENFLLNQVPPGHSVSNMGGAEERFGVQLSGKFGASPFFIHVGPLPFPDTGFNLQAPTTALNMFRVLRAMQLRKPVLLEGSPGVGKTR